MNTRTAVIGWVLAIAIAIGAGCSFVRAGFPDVWQDSVDAAVKEKKWRSVRSHTNTGEEAIGAVIDYYERQLLGFEVVYSRFPGKKESGDCRRLIGNFGQVMDSMMFLAHSSNDPRRRVDADMVESFFRLMPDAYQRFRSYRQCGISKNAIRTIHIPRIESLLRAYPALRTVPFKAAVVTYLDKVDGWLSSDSYRRNAARARQELVRLIPKVM